MNHLFLELLKNHGMKNGARGLWLKHRTGLWLGEGKSTGAPPVLPTPARRRPVPRGQAWVWRFLDQEAGGMARGGQGVLRFTALLA